MHQHLALPVVFLILLAASCQRKAQPNDFPTPVDTSTRPIDRQVAQAWTFPNGLKLDNQFPAARLSRVTDQGDHLAAWTEPENAPINTSPWYAFRVVAPRDTTVTVQLNYPAHAVHRYWPKLSTDRTEWTRLDSSALSVDSSARVATLQLQLAARKPLYVSAQEIIDSRDVRAWADGLTKNANVSLGVIGQSLENRPLLRLTIKAPGAKKKLPTVVLLSRQHPPEVTGFLALQGFLDGLLSDPRLSEFLQSYQLLIYPLLNPDGVDRGHWRHTAAGIDGNRDWAYYRQPETRQVADDIVATTRKRRTSVVLGLDFHSTWKDVYYTHDTSVRPPSVLGDFKGRWLAGIEREIGGDFRINEEAEPIGKPTTMSWFRTQFGAEGITYEIGDNTPRDFVERKGRVSARVMITELLSAAQ
ncbi:M14 family metallopeptidase [Neolewinella antarctica]|uniref:Peptidase M14 domain-containing protein n=1 Tax=Neolewinella antarctica TaxID=442734 RepID=A0ABX0XBD8_9BACT|nr:M14 family metallopeptidase [Neolewinella antarctica]NJC26588.1 hypothetical protein [Neolewinella antarctica]